MSMDFLVQVCLASLASWRICHILLNENGPYAVFTRLRAFLGVEETDFGDTVSYRYEITICIYCLSIWIAALAYFLPKEILAIFAISTIVVFLEKLHGYQRVKE